MKKRSAEFESLTPTEQDAVKKLAGDSWEKIGRLNEMQVIDKALALGLLPQSAMRLKKSNRANAWKGAIFFFVIVALILVKCTESQQSKTQPEEEADNSEKSCHDEIMAWIKAKEYVAKQLKAPSTAVFPARGTSKIHEYAGCKFKVLGYVDAQNSFGTMIRTHYDVVVKYAVDIDKWVPIKVELD